MGRKSPTPLALSEVVRIVGADSAYLYLCLEGSERLFLKKAEGAEGREVDPGAASAVGFQGVRIGVISVRGRGRASSRSIRSRYSAWRWVLRSASRK